MSSIEEFKRTCSQVVEAFKIEKPSTFFQVKTHLGANLKGFANNDLEIERIKFILEFSTPNISNDFDTESDH